MARNKKYTVRVSYKVYDYYTIEAKNEQEAIEQALEVSATDSLNDFTQDGEGEAIVTMIGNKSVEPEKKDMSLFFNAKDFDIRLFAQVLSGIYNVYYDSCNYGEEYTTTVWKGCALSRAKENEPLVAGLAECRKDLLTSDREFASFAITYEIFKKRYSENC